MEALISLHTKLKVSSIFTLVLFSLNQMTPLHLVVESNRIKITEWFLDQEADINLQDETEVILQTNAVDYFQLGGRYCRHCSFTLLAV